MLSGVKRPVASNGLINSLFSLFSRFYLPVLGLYPANIYLFKVNNRNSKLTRKAPERHNWRRSGVFIVNFKYISHLLVFTVDFEQVNVSWIVFSVIYIISGIVILDSYLKKETKKKRKTIIWQHNRVKGNYGIAIYLLYAPFSATFGFH